MEEFIKHFDQNETYKKAFTRFLKETNSYNKFLKKYKECKKKYNIEFDDFITINPFSKISKNNQFSNYHNEPYTKFWKKKNNQWNQILLFDNDGQVSNDVYTYYIRKKKKKEKINNIKYKTLIIILINLLVLYYSLFFFP